MARVLPNLAGLAQQPTEEAVVMRVHYCQDNRRSKPRPSRRDSGESQGTAGRTEISTLEIKEFTDYVVPNIALSDGSLDANYFQHVPYLDEFKEQNKLDLTWSVAIHFEPMGLYSKKITGLDELKDGDQDCRSQRYHQRSTGPPASPG
ncbi:MAG: MetQ/NlpA family ABC transporter substrate-binding protein [Bacillota bacterium]